MHEYCGTVIEVIVIMRKTIVALVFWKHIVRNRDDMDEGDSKSNLHPHWEVAPNPYGVEAHHKGGDELDHLTVCVP